MTGCIAARSVMAKARSREATITKFVKVEAVVDVEDELEIRVSSSDQTVVESATVKVKIEENRNGRSGVKTAAKQRCRVKQRGTRS
jgi:hypothetical protein